METKERAHFQIGLQSAVYIIALKCLYVTIFSPFDQTSHSATTTMDRTTEELDYIINHVFVPPKLPQECDDDRDVALCRMAYEAAVQFPEYLAECHRPQWGVVTRMLENLLGTTRLFSEVEQASKIVNLQVGGRFS